MSAYFATDKPEHTAENHWHQLRVLLQQCPRMAAPLLRRPCPAHPPRGTDLDQLEQYAQQAGLATLFAKHLASGLLLAGNGASDPWKQYIEKVFRRHLPELDTETALKAAWTSVPVLTCQGQAGAVVWFLLGRTANGTGITGSGRPKPDTTAHRSIVAALQQISGTVPGYIYWSLQDEHDQAVGGASLGLPIALAAHLLDRNHHWPDGLFATGVIGASRRLLPVAHVEEKYHTASWENRLFLMPPGDLPAAAANLADTLSCATLDDALFAVSWFSRGISPEKSSLYQACLHDPDLLLNRFHVLPAELLSFPQYRKPLRHIEKNPEKYLGRLSDSLQRCGYDPTRGQHLVRLCPVQAMASLIDRLSGSGLDLFRWCLAQISYRNHLGDVSGCREWMSHAARLGKRMAYDPEIGQFFNHRMVTLRFNRFDFRPEPPEELAAFLQTEERLREIAPRDNWLLGAIYGTLAQNYGFCGPDWFTDLVRMSCRAEAAFGRKYRRETRRLLNYQIYGLLDRGRLEDAGEQLRIYLAPDNPLPPDPARWWQALLSGPENPDQDRPFIIATAMRFFADTAAEDGKDAIIIPPEQTALLIQQHTTHPWQLTALNLGRIFQACDRKKEAQQMFRHSLQTCLRGGETLRAMSLLPLAELHKNRQADTEDYRLTKKIHALVTKESSLRHEHFTPLLRLDAPEEILDEIISHRSRYFPFTYR